MTQTIAKLGDRLLALIVPEHHAAADECSNQYRCGPYGCTGTMDYKVRKQVRTVCRAAGPGAWRNTPYCCYI
ncbi:hypothetical protein FAF44_26455 [Nonomuraea sp. MG754425]|uniref:hypothetical protein n=1 Tax=Nonomuraea sp. MG754425 TaxID=2570319 RepID=UPI001F16CF12|nr:hypothetical protein [Nonomuraea sp. MG754425]MCF6471906.1 hypothetical protein [Nonomuraea sp. MG754425]